LIQGEINKIMLARESEEYAIRVVDPTVAHERPFSLQPGNWILFGLLSGLIVSMIVVVYGPNSL
jgi:hypothetical protein